GCVAPTHPPHPPSMMMSPFGDSASFGVRCSLGICRMRGISKHGRRARSNTLLASSSTFSLISFSILFHLLPFSPLVAVLSFLEGRAFSPASERAPTLSATHLEGLGTTGLKAPPFRGPKTSFSATSRRFACKNGRSSAVLGAGRNLSPRPLVARIVRIVPGWIVVARVAGRTRSDSLFQFFDVEKNRFVHLFIHLFVSL